MGKDKFAEDAAALAWKRAIYDYFRSQPNGMLKAAKIYRYYIKIRQGKIPPKKFEAILAEAFRETKKRKAREKKRKARAARK